MQDEDEELEFEDPYEDEYAEEDIEEGDDDDDDDMAGGGGQQPSSAGSAVAAAAADGRRLSNVAEQEEGDDDEDGDDETGAGAGAGREVWRPGVDGLAEGEQLDFDPAAYVMYHAIVRRRSATSRLLCMHCSCLARCVSLSVHTHPC